MWDFRTRAPADDFDSKLTKGRNGFLGFLPARRDELVTFGIFCCHMKCHFWPQKFCIWGVGGENGAPAVARAPTIMSHLFVVINRQNTHKKMTKIS